MTRMQRRAAAALLAIVLLAPAAIFAWRYRDMPQFGDTHDDGLYYVCAYSLAGGHGYRILSLPDAPWQTKYPPLYPLYLSIAWRLNPSFPNNLPIATLLSFLPLPVAFGLVLLLYREYKLPVPERWVLAALFALNSYVIFFSARMFSELLFTCFMLAAVVLLERASRPASPAWLAAVAGLIAGLAYLTRSAGIALFAAGIAALIIRKQFARATAFGLAMAPAIAGWMLWSRTHQARTSDLVTMYYTDYLGYQLINVTPSTLPLFLYRNLDELFYGMGSLFFPKITESFLVKMLCVTVAVGAIAGIVRFMRASGKIVYPLFAAFTVTLLVVWHFPPNERFVVPLFPLMLIGISIEVRRIFTMVRAARAHADAAQRAAARIIGAVAALFVAAGVALQFVVVFALLPLVMQDHRQRLAEARTAYEWIRKNTGSDARLAAYDDPLVFLYTGRRATSLPVLPVHWYRRDHESLVAPYGKLDQLGQKYNLQYAYYARWDFERDREPEDARRARAALARSSAPAYQTANTAVYRLRKP